MAATDNADIIFVLGGPGTGKGTVCAALSEEFSMPHLSMGDLLRAEVKLGTELGKEISSFIDFGNVCPARVTIKLLKTAIDRCRAREMDGMTGQEKIRGVLVDGFPRSMEQLEQWEKDVGKFGFALYLAVKDQETLVKRILDRAARGESERTDDDEPTVRKRLQVNQELCEPCVAHYRKTPGLIVDVDADASKEAVLDICRTHVREHLERHKL